MMIVREKLKNATLPTRNHTWTVLGMNLDLDGLKLVTKCLSYGTAYI
jgi:hypothetical protein